MDTAIKKPSRHQNVLFWLIILTLCIGIGLSILAWMNICSQACAAGHKYRLYGMAFEPIGVAFFSISLMIFIFSKKNPQLRLVGGAMVFGALGAELTFTYAQKAVVGHWCPICLSIAATVFVATGLLVIDFMQKIRLVIAHNDKGGLMKSFMKFFGAVMMITVGFMFSYMGFAKFNKLHAMEGEMKKNLTFGTSNNNVEVYIFTDWKCQSCRKIEPIIEAAFPKMTAKAQVMFVDYAVHDESLNFTPYNLSFMINNKKEYLKLRDFLTELSRETNTPSETQITAGAKKLGVTFKPLNYSDVSSGIKYFEHLVTEFDLEGTPIIVVVNSGNKKGKKLSGAAEISEKSILNAIDAISKN